MINLDDVLGFIVIDFGIRQVIIRDALRNSHIVSNFPDDLSLAKLRGEEHRHILQS
jgi:hypothetical protein